MTKIFTNLNKKLNNANHHYKELCRQKFFNKTISVIIKIFKLKKKLRNCTETVINNTVSVKELIIVTIVGKVRKFFSNNIKKVF